MRLALAIASLLLLTAPPAAAQADSDGDGIPNALELSGFAFDIVSGEVEACTPGVDDPCFVTDPLSWSSDGDPYSDFQEASGVNMDAGVDTPYNSPLVAAYPVIEVWLDTYTFTSNATITDSNGGSLSRGMSFTSSTESTVGGSVKAGFNFNPLDGFGLSGEVEASYSETKSYGNEVTSGTELNWETATTTQVNDAGTLSLSLFARNAGGATALNVRPTFNVYIGIQLVATVLPDAPFQLSLAPGESSPAVIPIVEGAPLAITLPLSRLVALQRGAAVTIEVVDVEADIQRWRPQDSNWACDSGDTCTWTSFQNQIEPRTLRLLVDFGYSGDPGAEIPAQYRGNPFEYRIYTGSPSSSPEVTLRAALHLSGFDVTGSGGTVSIEDRSYPSTWIVIEQPRRDGVAPIEEAWQAAGQPQSLIDVVMPRQATLFLSSPDPLNPGVALRASTVSADFLDAIAVAAPRGGLPITSARAVLEQYGRRVEVPLVEALDGAYWTTEGSDIDLDVPIGLASSYVEFTDLAGAVQRSDGLTSPVTLAASCAEVPTEEYRNRVAAGSDDVITGLATIFPTSDLDVPVEVYCVAGSDVTRYWAPQPGMLTEQQGAPLRATVLSDGTAVGVGQGITRSEDHGRSWVRVPEEFPINVLLDVDDRPGTQTVIAVGLMEESGTLRSEDGGRSWTLRSSNRNFSAVSHAEGDVWYAIAEAAVPGEPDRVRRSDDDGQSFSSLSLPEVPADLVDVEFRDANTGLLLDDGNGVGGTGRIWRTTNGGASWENAFTATNTKKVTYAGDDTWYITTGTFSGFDAVLRSRDNGVSWTVIALNDFGATNLFDVAFSSPDVGFVTDGAGIFRTEDGGDTWHLEETGLLSVRYKGAGLAVFDENRAVAFGSDLRRGAGQLRGLALLTTSGGTGMVAVSNEPTELGGGPTTLSLDAPYPNPFTGEATLAYTLAAPGDVSLTVYDLLGREVARLVDGPQPAGAHTVPFDGRRLASGVYVARLTVGDRAETRRMTHLR